jgi:hypothetical protein
MGKRERSATRGQPLWLRTRLGRKEGCCQYASECVT